MNKLPNGYNTISNDLQVTLTIWDYNQNATARLNVDLIIIDLEETNKPPTTKEKKTIYALYALKITTTETNYMLSYYLSTLLKP